MNLSPLLIVIDVPISLPGHAAFGTDTDHLEHLKRDGGKAHIGAFLAKTSSRFQPSSSDMTPEIPEERKKTHVHIRIC